MLHVTCFGNKASPPMLFLHGLLGSTEDFLPMIEGLRDTFYCISVDLPGHGLSSCIHPFTLNTTLETLRSIMQHYNFSKGYIVGYSLGGRLAMLLEYYYPDLFSKVIILSAHPGLSSEEKEKRLVLENKWIYLLEKDLTTFLTYWYSQALFNTLDIPSMLQKRSTLKKDSIIQVMKTFSITKQISLWDHLNNTKTPFLFLHGQHDKVYKELYKKLPSRLTQKAISLASHAIHLENPLECSKALLDFC